MYFTKPATSFSSFAACAAPVRTCAFAGVSLRRRSTSVEGETPCFACTEIAVKLAPRRNSFCAVRTSKIANVAPPSESTSPYFAMPTIFTGKMPASTATRVWSPTEKPYLAAAFLSITTSPSRAAQRPPVRCIGLNSSSPGLMPTPNVGFPPPPMILPRLS